jgi:hypothetical protein
MLGLIPPFGQELRSVKGHKKQKRRGLTFVNVIKAFQERKKAAAMTLACRSAFAYPWAIRRMRRFCEDNESWPSTPPHTELSRRPPRAA